MELVNLSYKKKDLQTLGINCMNVEHVLIILIIPGITFTGYDWHAS